MYNIKNRFSVIIRTVSLVVVCLFTINTLAWAYPPEDESPKKYDLAVQSIFKPIADAGVEVSAKMQFEILAGAMLLLSGRSAAATNAYLAETYIKSKSTEIRKIEFLEIIDRERGLPATFKIVGKDDLIFELDFQGTLTGDKGMNRVPKKPKLPADISGKVMKYANFLNDNGVLLIRKLTRSKDEREAPQPEISDVEPPEKETAIPYTANTFAWRTVHTADWEPQGFMAILKRLLQDAPAIIRSRIKGNMPAYAISRTLPAYDTMTAQMYDATPELNRGISGLIESYISKNRSENKTTTYLDACGGLGCAATEASVRYGRDGVRVYMTDIVEWTADDVSKGDARKIRREGEKRGIEDILSRQFEFINADVVSVRLPEKMDLITNIAGLQYTDDPLQAIVNLYNQLKIGGTLLTGYWVRQENKSALEHFYITLEAIARLGAKVGVKTTYLEGEGAYIIAISINRNDDRDIKLNLIPAEVKKLDAADEGRDLFQKVVYYRADGSGSAISIKVPLHDANVTCGTICQAGHEGSYQALDEQLARKFAEYKTLLGITGDRDLTESEVDLALQRQGHIQDPNQLDEIRQWVRQRGSIPDNISIFFGVPEDGKTLWYVGEDYAGGHFNQKGTRIHISLPLILSQKDQKEAALAIARHDYNHIDAIRRGAPEEGHKDDDGMMLVREVAKLDAIAEARKSYYYLGMSMGGDKLAMAIVDGNNNIVGRPIELRWEEDERFKDGKVKIKTHAKADEVMDAVADMAAKLMADNGIKPFQIRMVNASLPGSVDKTKGLLGVDFPSPNAPFDKYPFRIELEKRLASVGIVVSKIDMAIDVEFAKNGEHFSPRGKLVGKTGGIVIIGGGINISVDGDDTIKEGGHNLYQAKDGDGSIHYVWGGVGSGGGHPIEIGNDPEKIKEKCGKIGEEYVLLGDSEFRKNHPDYPFIDWSGGLRDFEDMLSGPSIRRRVSDSVENNLDKPEYRELKEIAYSEDLVGEGKSGQYERALTIAALRGNLAAKEWIRAIGEEIGLALAAFIGAYPDRPFVENLILVSGVNENMGIGVDEVEGVDIYIRAIRESVCKELEDRFSFEKSRAAHIAAGVARSDLTYEREMISYQSTDEEVLAALHNTSGMVRSGPVDAIKMGALEEGRQDDGGVALARKTALRKQVKEIVAHLEGRTELKEALSLAADIMYEVDEGRSRWPEYDQWALVKWHGYTHAADIALKTIESMKNVMAADASISHDSILIAAIACMYHDIGYYRHDEEGFGTLGIDHEKRSMDFVREHREALGLTEQDAKLVNLAILATQLSFDPADLDRVEAEASGDNDIRGAIYGARILGTLDVYDTRDEMMSEPIKVVGMLRAEYIHDRDALRNFMATVAGANVEDAKVKKAKYHLSRLESLAMPSDEEQFAATEAFYAKVADKRVASFGIWRIHIPEEIKNIFEKFRAEHFERAGSKDRTKPTRAQKRAARLAEIDARREEAFIKYWIYDQDELIFVKGLYRLFADGEPLERFSSYEKVAIWQYMALMDIRARERRDNLRPGQKTRFDTIEDEIRRMARGLEVDGLFIGYEWTDHLAHQDKSSSIENNITIKPGMNMLDIGCGYGNVVIDLAARYPKSQFVGIDANPHNLAHAVTRLVEMGDKAPANVRFHIADARARIAGVEVPHRGVPYNEGRFDVVSVLEGVMDEASFQTPWQALLWQEAVRVTNKDGGKVAFFGLAGQDAFRPSIPEGVYAEQKPNTFFFIDGRKTKYYFPTWTTEDEPSIYRREKCELYIWELNKKKAVADSIDTAKTSAPPSSANAPSEPERKLEGQIGIDEWLASQEPEDPGIGPGGASILEAPVAKMEEARRLFMQHAHSSTRKTGEDRLRAMTLLEEAIEVFEFIAKNGLEDEPGTLGFQQAQIASIRLTQAQEMLKEEQEFFNRWWLKKIRSHSTPYHTYPGRTVYTQSVVEELAGQNDVIVEVGIGDKDAPTFVELKKALKGKSAVRAIEFSSGNITEGLAEDVAQDNILALKRGGEAAGLISQAKVIRIANLVEKYFNDAQCERLLYVMNKLMADGAYLIIATNVSDEHMFEDEEGYIYQKVGGELQLQYFISSQNENDIFKDGIDIGLMKAIPASSEFISVPEAFWPPWQDKNAPAIMLPIGGSQARYDAAASFIKRTRLYDLIEPGTITEIKDLGAIRSTRKIEPRYAGGKISVREGELALSYDMQDEETLVVDGLLGCSALIGRAITKDGRYLYIADHILSDSEVGQMKAIEYMLEGEDLELVELYIDGTKGTEIELLRGLLYLRQHLSDAGVRVVMNDSWNRYRAYPGSVVVTKEGFTMRSYGGGEPITHSWSLKIDDRGDSPVSYTAEKWDEARLIAIDNAIADELFAASRNKLRAAPDYKSSFLHDGKPFPVVSCGSNKRMYYWRIGHLYFIAEDYFKKLSPELQKTLNKNVIRIPPVSDRIKKTLFDWQEFTMTAVMEMLNNKIESRRAIDLGSGGGVLSAAALRLGASSVDMVEVNRTASKQADELMRLNGFADGRHYRKHIFDLSNDKDAIVEALNAIGHAEEVVVISQIGNWGWEATNFDSAKIAAKIPGAMLFIAAGYPFDTSLISHDYYSEIYVLETSGFKKNKAVSVAVLPGGKISSWSAVRENIKADQDAVPTRRDSVDAGKRPPMGGGQDADKTNLPVVADILSIDNPSPLAEEMIKNGVIASGMSVLSLGSGNGNDEAFFASKHCNVLATDNNTQILTHLRTMAAKQEGLQVQAIDCEKPLGIPSGSFDVVYVRLVLHYFNNTTQRQLFDEIFRALKPGGKAIIQMKSKNDVLYAGEKVEEADGMAYFPAKKFSRNHIDVNELSDRVKMSGFDMLSINEHLEKLYSDDYDSTLITAICIKQRDVLKNLVTEHKDEHALMVDSARSLNGYPVNMPIDISLIPREKDGLTAEQAASQLEDNIETLARLMAWQNMSGLDVRYALMDSDEDYRSKALGLLKEKLRRLAAMPGMKLDVEAMLKLHIESNTIEIPLIDIETLKGMKSMPDNVYPVALLRDMEGVGVNMPNYTAAAAIGLSLAGLRIASQKDTEREYKAKLKEAFETIERIYKRWGVDTKDFNKSALDMMVNANLNFSGESRRQLIISLKLALPPMLKAAIDKLHEVHQALQILLQSA